MRTTFDCDQGAGIASAHGRKFWVQTTPVCDHRAGDDQNRKREKLDDEYRKAVEAIADAQSKGGRPKKDEKPPQIIVEVNRSERETDHKLAKANGTNRTLNAWRCIVRR